MFPRFFIYLILKKDKANFPNEITIIILILHSEFQSRRKLRNFIMATKQV